MNYVDIDKAQILPELEKSIKKQVNQQLAMMPTNVSIDRVEWAENGIRVWLEDEDVRKKKTSGGGSNAPTAGKIRDNGNNGEEPTG